MKKLEIVRMGLFNVIKSSLKIYEAAQELPSNIRFFLPGLSWVEIYYSIYSIMPALNMQKYLALNIEKLIFLLFMPSKYRYKGGIMKYKLESVAAPLI